MFYTIDQMRAMQGRVGRSFIGTIDEDQMPRITIISSLALWDDKTLVFGDVFRGISKVNFKKRPTTFTAIINNELTTVYATWQSEAIAGEKFELMGNLRTTRYNTTGGFARIQSFELGKYIRNGWQLNEQEQKRSKEETCRLASRIKCDSDVVALNVFAYRIATSEHSVKMLCYINEKGYPIVIPTSQALPISPNKMVFRTTPLNDDFKKIAPGAKIAILSYDLVKELGAILAQGVYSSEYIDGLEMGILDIEKVYCSSGQTPQYIYPRKPLKLQVVFGGVSDINI